MTIDTWRSLPGPLGSAREDDITNTLCRALRAKRTIRELPFLVDTQVVELDPAAGEDLGRLDIAFKPTGLSGPPSESIYFCLECKRLNVRSGGRTRTFASEYVLHGMMRFVSGQYASAVRHGGMLGYVLDGNVQAAIASIEANVQRQCMALRMDRPGQLRPSSILTAESAARETLHLRKHASALFLIHDLSMAAPTLAATRPPAQRRSSPLK